MARGVLTPEVSKLAKKLLGRNISVTELRLMPYIMLKLMDNEDVDPAHVNRGDRVVFALWKEKDYIDNVSTDLTVSSEFYDIMVQIIKVGYCSSVIHE